MGIPSAAGAEPNKGALWAAAPARSRSRSAASTRATAPANSCRATPNENASSSWAARALRTVRPRSVAAARVALQQRRLAQARRALEHDARAGPSGGGAQGVADRGQLGRALEQPL